MRVHSGIMFSSTLSKLMSRGAVALVRDTFDGLEGQPAGLELAMLKWQRLKAKRMLTRW